MYVISLFGETKAYQGFYRIFPLLIPLLLFSIVQYLAAYNEK